MQFCWRHIHDVNLPQRCSIRWRPGECGGHLSTVWNSAQLALRAHSVPRKYPPHRPGFTHAFIMFMPNSDPTIRMSQHQSRLIRLDNIFPIFSVLIGEPMWIVGSSHWLTKIVASVSCSYPTAVAPSMVLCCYSSSASKLDVLCVQGYFSAHLYCSELLLELLIAGLAILLWPCINEAFSSRELLLFGCFRFSGLFSVNPKDACVGKSQ